MSVKTLLLGLIKIFGSALNPDLMDEMLKFKEITCTKCNHTKCEDEDVLKLCRCDIYKVRMMEITKSKDILLRRVQYNDNLYEIPDETVMSQDEFIIKNTPHDLPHRVLFLKRSITQCLFLIIVKTIEKPSDQYKYLSEISGNDRLTNSTANIINHFDQI